MFVPHGYSLHTPVCVCVWLVVVLVLNVLTDNLPH